MTGANLQPCVSHRKNLFGKGNRALLAGKSSVMQRILATAIVQAMRKEIKQFHCFQVHDHRGPEVIQHRRTNHKMYRGFPVRASNFEEFEGAR